MKKTLLTFLALFLAFSFAQAENFYYEIKQEFSVSKIETELQTVIDNATNNDIVTVTGSKTNADATLTLNIAAGKTVVWQATYQSGSPFWADHLISFSGAGTFVVENGSLLTANANGMHASGEGSAVIVRDNGKVQTSGEGMNAIITYGYVEIKDNAHLSSTTGETIASHSDNATVLVTGGTVSATSENAIITWGKNSQILISGGYVSNDADGYSMVINAKDNNPNNDALVHVSGTGKVEAKGYGDAIYTDGRVIVSGNAQVSIIKGGNYAFIGAIRTTRDILLTDFAKVSASNKYAICAENIIVSGNSIVEAKGDAIAIAIGNVVISDYAQVIAANNCAISSHNSVMLDGGMAFAYGNKLSDIIKYQTLTGPTNFGIVLAWDKDAGNTNYEIFSSDDIFIYPDPAMAYWDIKDGERGIFYASGDNTGFIPLDVNILSVDDSNLPNIEVYPNPTTGQLRIANRSHVSGKLSEANYELRITGVEVYDVYGRKVLEPPLTVLHSYDLTVLPAGVYFVRIETEGGAVVKKIVKC